MRLVHIKSILKFQLLIETDLNFVKLFFPFDSLILNGNNQLGDLMSLCEISNQTKWRLIYRASVDGFLAKNFHENCDEKKNVLVLISTRKSHIFGGYSEHGWNSASGFLLDKNAFIFSLQNHVTTPFKLKCSDQNHSIGCNANYGPVFGRDLIISDNSNRNVLSSSHIGHSYEHPMYACESNEATTLLAGSHMFQTNQIEVFTRQE